MIMASLVSHLKRRSGCTGQSFASILIESKTQPDLSEADERLTMICHRIFACRNQGTTDDILVQALLRAEADGCQVVSLVPAPLFRDARSWNNSDAFSSLLRSMSFNTGSSDWGDDYPPRTVINGLTAKGMIFVAASGNEGASGIFTAQDPAIVSSVLSVGSVDVTAFARVFALGLSVASSQPIRYLSTLPVPTNSSMPIFFLSKSTQLDPSNSACGPLPTNVPDLSNTIVVIQLTSACNLVTQQIHLSSRNARYILVHDIANSVTTAAQFYTSSVDSGNYLLGMTKDDGLRLLSYSKSNPNLRVDFRNRQPLPPVPNIATGGRVSAFSSYGPSNTLASAGVHVVAPGGSILSTFPRSMGSIGIISGTSMSTPLVAGAVALLLSSPSSKGLSPDQLRALIATTAEPVSSTSSSIPSVLVQGGESGESDD